MVRLLIMKKKSIKRPNVLFISLDCVRYDHLGCYGYQEVETPNIDAIAAEGVRFKQAICQVPFTTPSHASMLTGLYPFNHNIRLLIGQFLAQSIPTFGSILKKEGYVTGGFPSIFLMNRDNGFQNGFDVYDDKIETKREGFRGPWRPGHLTTDALLKFINSNKQQPFVAFVHYFDPHDYDPGHPESMSSYDGKIAEADQYIGRLINSLKRGNLWENTLVVITADHGDSFGEHGLHGHGKALYDEVLRVPLIIRVPKLISPCLVIDQQVRLIDILPTLLDLIGIYNKVQEKGIQFDGVSLRPAMEGEELGLSAYAETSPIQLFTGDLLEAKEFKGVEMMCLRTKDKKYIYKTKFFNRRQYNNFIKKEKGNKYVGVKKVQKLLHIAGRILITHKMPIKIDFFNTHKYIKILKSIFQHQNVFNYSKEEELYDLTIDPGEKCNLATRNPQLCRKFKSQLNNLIQRQSKDYTKSNIVEWSKDEKEIIRERLKSLGYLE